MLEIRQTSIPETRGAPDESLVPEPRDPPDPTGAPRLGVLWLDLLQDLLEGDILQTNKLGSLEDFPAEVCRSDESDVTGRQSPRVPPLFSIVDSQVRSDEARSGPPASRKDCEAVGEDDDDAQAEGGPACVRGPAVGPG